MKSLLLGLNLRLESITTIIIDKYRVMSLAGYVYKYIWYMYSMHYVYYYIADESGTWMEMVASNIVVG